MVVFFWLREGDVVVGEWKEEGWRKGKEVDLSPCRACDVNSKKRQFSMRFLLNSAVYCGFHIFGLR